MNLALKITHVVTVLCVVSCPAIGSTLRLSTPQMDDVLVVVPGATASIPIQLENIGVSPATVLTTMVGLSAVQAPQAVTTGHLTITSITVSSEPFFDPPMLIVSEVEGVHIMQDANPVGEVLPASVNSELAIMNLQLSEDADGLFFVLIEPIGDQFGGSKYLELVGGPPMPAQMPFLNKGSEVLGGRSVLLAIGTRPPVVGDYDYDGLTAQSDYEIWRSMFGNEPPSPGFGPDGNSDGVVSIADYTVWRDHVGTSTPSSSSLTAVLEVPEPRYLAVIAIACWAIYARRNTRF